MMKPGNGKIGKRGMAIVLALAAFVIMVLVFGTLLYSSRHEVGFVELAFRRAKAQYIAEAGAAVAQANIMGGKFEERFYKGEQQGPYGFVGHLAGDYGDGDYYVVCEDIVNPISKPEKEFARATYNRIDLFSRGTYKGTAVVVYKALILHPEEKVYAYKTRESKQPDGKTMTETYDISVR